MNISHINSRVTLKFLTESPENLYFDRKRAKVSPQDLANEIASSANANGGMLLFGKNPSVYLPSARVRVLEFEGTEFQFGTEMNIVKDRTFDSCLYKVVEETKSFINMQLREFTHLSMDGIFVTVPEYPEFAWYEGLVNAVTHRDYSNSGGIYNN